MLRKSNKENTKEGLKARLYDLAYQCERHGRQTNSVFLTEAEVIQAKECLGKKVAYILDGGYGEAQRCRVSFVSEDVEFQSSVVCLCAKINQKFVKITHRDVLGALMGLDLERSQFGDMFVLEDRIVVYCTDTIADYVMQSCTSISRLSVQFEKTEELFENLQRYEEKTINVASMRLDNVVSSLIPSSRSLATSMIKAGKVSINHEMIEDCDKLCHNNDTVSISGVGRFILIDEGKTSRKERRIIKVKKFL